jgi:hypothetical protein
VQRECVAGSGAKVRPWASAASRSVSHTTPGSTRARNACASIDNTRSRYFEQSITTATLTVCPLSEVAPPRARTGTPFAAQMRIAATTSSTLRGSTTPIGTCR